MSSLWQLLPEVLRSQVSTHCGGDRSSLQNLEAHDSALQQHSYSKSTLTKGFLPLRSHCELQCLWLAFKSSLLHTMLTLYYDHKRTAAIQCVSSPPSHEDRDGCYPVSHSECIGIMNGHMLSVCLCLSGKTWGRTPAVMLLPGILQ